MKRYFVTLVVVAVVIFCLALFIRDLSITQWHPAF